MATGANDSSGPAASASWVRSPGSPVSPRRITTVNPTGHDSLVRRNQPISSDRLPRSKGTFSICLFHYVEALSRAGRVEEGRYIVEKMLTHANHVGHVRREIGPAGEALGNFPPTLLSSAPPATSTGPLGRATFGRLYGR
jgi:hypothetical protein